MKRGAVVDRYTILERVGRGGMGEVYAAYDAKLDRRVALKLLLSGSEYGARLSREAQAMARLSHPNVVAVFDTGMFDGRLFLAMEFVEGTTLRGWQRAAPRTVAEILHVFMEAGRGLSAAHEAGLVHRDFKPDNVLVSTHGAVKVTDFGLVRAAEEGTEATAADALERLATKLASAPPLAASGADDVATAIVVPRPLESEAPETVVGTPAARVSDPEARVRDLPGGDSLHRFDSLPSQSSRSGSLDAPMTEIGVLLGTPGYMAPEQYLSGTLNARTDQFSFCVALYDALYGQKPFASKELLELAEEVMAGAIREPPKGTQVPAYIHRALVRGLRTKNEDRYPSMQALLDDLARDPAKRRRRIGATALAFLAIGGLVFATQRISSARQGHLCSGADTLAQEVWSEPVKQSVERAMLATKAPFAADTWARTRAELDAYMGRWTAMHEQTCRATRIEGHQSEALMATRVTCLEQRRGQARALTRVLEEADRQTVEKAVEAARNLPSVADCADVTSLTAVKALPADPAVRGEIEGLRREVGELRVRADAGKYKEAAAQAPALVERARAIGYEPLLAEALFVQGDAQSRVSMKAEAASTLRDAVYAAEAGRTEDLLVRSLLALVVVLADQRKPDDAREMGRFAEAAATRLTDPEAYRYEQLSASAWVLFRSGNVEASAVEFRKAIAAVERIPDANPVRVSRIYSRAGAVLADAGHFEEAFDLLDRADVALARALGPDHPARLSLAVNRSASLVDAGRWAEAVAVTDTALDIGGRVLPKDSATMANLHNNRAGALDWLGRFDEALASSQRAVEISEAVYGPKTVSAAGLAINRAETLSALGRSAEAIAAFGDILAIVTPALPPTHEWLAEVRAGRGEANVALHAWAAALPDLESAVEIYRGITHRTTVASLSLAIAEAALARALWESGGKSPRVEALSRSAHASFEALHDDARARDTAAWAKGHSIDVAIVRTADAGR